MPKFSHWSQYEGGFYPGTEYFERSGLWKPSSKPVKWIPALIEVFDWLFTFDKRGQMPVDDFFLIEGAKAGKTMAEAAVGDYCGRYVDKGIPGEIIFAANSQTQADIRAFGVLQASLRRNPHVDQIVEGGRNGIMESEIRYKDTGHVVRRVPKNAASQAGSNAVAIIIDEIHALKRGRDAAWLAEMKPSTTRNVSLRFYGSYTGYWGDDGWLTEELGGFVGEDGLPTAEAKRVPGLEHLPLLIIGRRALWWNHDPTIYPWNTPDRLERLRQQYRLMPNEFRRQYYAEIVQSEEALFPPSVWHRNTDETWEGLKPGETQVGMVGAVDLGAVRDSCGVVWRGIDPDTNRLPLYGDTEWKPRDYKTQSPGYILNEVKQHILDMHRTHKVFAVGIDPSQAYLMGHDLEQAGVKVELIGQVATRETMDTAYRQLVYEGRLRNYRNAGALTEHVLAAVAKTTPDLKIRIVKDKTTKMIDLCVADSMCCAMVEQYKSQLTNWVRNKGKPAWKPRPSRWAGAN